MSPIEDLRDRLLATTEGTAPTLASLQLRARQRHRRRRSLGAVAAAVVVVATASVALTWPDGDGSEQVAAGGGAGGARGAPAAVGATAVVYLSAEAPATAVAAVQELLDRYEDLSSYRFVGKDEAYERFVDLFEEDSPELVEAVTPDALPEQFDVWLVDASCAGVERLRAALAAIDEVRHVEATSSC